MMKRYTAADVATALKAYDGEGKGFDNVCLLFSLPDTERNNILDMCATLSNAIPNMGPLLALEVITSLGRMWAKRSALATR